MSYTSDPPLPLPPPHIRPESRGGWQLVRRGLLAQLIGFGVSAISSVFLAGVLGFAAAVSRGPDELVIFFRPSLWSDVNSAGLALIGAFWFLMLASLLAGLVSLIGKFLCGLAPPESGSRWLALGSAGCDILQYLGSGCSGVLPLLGSSRRDSEVMLMAVLVVSLGVVVLALVSVILFLIFLHRVGKALASSRAAGSLRRFVIVLLSVEIGSILLGCLGGGVLFFCFVNRIGRGEEVVPLIMLSTGLLILLAQLVVFFAYIWLLFQVRAAIAERLASSATQN